MNEKIVSLIRLQEMDSSLEGLQQGKDKLGPQRDKLKADIQQLQTRFEDNKKSLTQAQVEKKNLELDIDVKEQAMRKNSGELNSVKTNEAYKALLTQIEDAKKAKLQIEDRVLEMMERIDQLQSGQKEAERALHQDKAVIEKNIQEMDVEEKRLEGEIVQKRKERDEFFLSLTLGIREPYESVQRSKKRGAVMVPINGSVCGGCQTTLPPSVTNEVLKGKDLISCETCSRILYIPSAPVASS